MNMTQTADGKMQMKATVNPLSTVDDWAVRSDGTVAFIRGHDYHIDWLYTDGSQVSSAKLPFDWKRLTDDDKQKLIDSARTAADKVAADAKANAGKPGAAGAEAAGVERLVAAMGAGGGGAMSGGGGGATIVMKRDGGGDHGGGADHVYTSGPGGAWNTGAPKIEFVQLSEFPRCGFMLSV